MAMLKLVLDTDVMVAAMRSPKGASSALLKAALHKEVVLVASVTLAIEYQSVCCRAEHELAAGFKSEEAEEFVRAAISLMEPITTYFLWRPQLNDPNDEMVLEAAVNGGANVLVTFNKRHFGIVSNRFGIETLTPAEAIKRIRL
jgi:putative PIN family toxin of toxin-antitoxin system